MHSNIKISVLYLVAVRFYRCYKTSVPTFIRLSKNCTNVTNFPFVFNFFT